jgi:hypothetical protein
MCLRTITVLILILSLSVPTTFSQEEIPQTDEPKQQEKLTPEEESEAREIAKEFIERFEENKNVLSLAGDFYVNDFVSRLRGRSENFYFVHLSPELWKKVSDTDVKKLYFLSLQFFHYCFMVYGAKEIIRTRNQKQAEDEDNDEMDMKEIVPLELISLMTRDETLREIWGAFINEYNGIENQQQNDDNDELKTNEQLKSYLEFLDDAILLMKKHLESLDAPHKWKPLMEELTKLDKKEIEDEDLLNPRVTVLTKDFHGSPEGTRLICINAMYFHMDLVRVDGKLKILNVYWEDD